MSEAGEYYGERDGVHLSDLCTFFWNEDGEFCPVFADSFNLDRFTADTGLRFKRLMNWSRRVSFTNIQELDKYTVFDCSTDMLDEDSTLELFCMQCGFTAGCGNWNRHDDDRAAVCPKCENRWGSGTIYHCQTCDWHGSLTAYEDDKKTRYWEPYCPECVRVRFLDSDESYAGEPMVVTEDDELAMITHTDRLDKDSREELARLHETTR